jgi:CMP/dCMP kinase
MIISFNGDEGSGKSTIAEKVAKNLGYPRYYMGQIFRDMAKKRGMTVAEYSEFVKEDPNVDREIDDYVVKLANEQSDFVIESRTAWHFVPKSLKIYLKVNDEEGARRIFKQLQKQEKDLRNEADKDATFQDIIQKISERRKNDDIRYRKFYDIDIRNPKNYDFVFDTTKFSKEEVFKNILDFVKKNLKK